MTQFNTPAYDIERPTGTCAVAGRKREPGEHYMAMLIEVDAPDGSTGKATASGGFGLKRLDVSMHAWEQGHRPQELFCFWRSTVPEPGRKKRLFVDDAVLMNLLDRLADTDKPQRLAFRFVLALILMRKRLLRYDGTQKRPIEGTQAEAREWWLVTPKLDLTKGPLGKWDDARQMQVLNPHLGEEQIRQVTEQLNEILEAEL